MEDVYFRWLVGFLDDEYLEKNYSKLLFKLFKKEFTWSLEYDENRAADGLSFRRIFKQEFQNLPENAHFWPILGCSVLEMMLGMARRCEDELIYSPKKGDQTGRFFWVMIENLGLDIYDDYGFYEEEVDKILDTFLARKYAPNGDGNVFVLRNSDPRKIDLWLQLNLYLREHFYDYWGP